MARWTPVLVGYLLLVVDTASTDRDNHTSASGEYSYEYYEDRDSNVPGGVMENVQDSFTENAPVTEGTTKELFSQDLVSATNRSNSNVVLNPDNRTENEQRNKSRILRYIEQNHRNLNISLQNQNRSNHEYRTRKHLPYRYKHHNITKPTFSPKERHSNSTQRDLFSNNSLNDYVGSHPPNIKSNKSNYTGETSISSELTPHPNIILSSIPLVNTTSSSKTSKADTDIGNVSTFGDIVNQSNLNNISNLLKKYYPTLNNHTIDNNQKNTTLSNPFNLIEMPRTQEKEVFNISGGNNKFPLGSNLVPKRKLDFTSIPDKNEELSPRSLHGMKVGSNFDFTHGSRKGSKLSPGTKTQFTYPNKTKKQMFVTLPLTDNEFTSGLPADLDQESKKESNSFKDLISNRKRGSASDFIFDPKEPSHSYFGSLPHFEQKMPLGSTGKNDSITDLPEFPEINFSTEKKETFRPNTKEKQQLYKDELEQINPDLNPRALNLAYMFGLLNEQKSKAHPNETGDSSNKRAFLWGAMFDTNHSSMDFPNINSYYPPSKNDYPVIPSPQQVFTNTMPLGLLVKNNTVSRAKHVDNFSNNDQYFSEFGAGKGTVPSREKLLVDDASLIFNNTQYADSDRKNYKHIPGHVRYNKSYNIYLTLPNENTYPIYDKLSNNTSFISNEQSNVDKTLHIDSSFSPLKTANFTDLFTKINESSFEVDSNEKPFLNEIVDANTEKKIVRQSDRNNLSDNLKPSNYYKGSREVENEVKDSSQLYLQYNNKYKNHQAHLYKQSKSYMPFLITNKPQLDNNMKTKKRRKLKKMKRKYLTDHNSASSFSMINMPENKKSDQIKNGSQLVKFDNFSIANNKTRQYNRTLNDNVVHYGTFILDNFPTNITAEGTNSTIHLSWNEVMLNGKKQNKHPVGNTSDVTNSSTDINSMEEGEKMANFIPAKSLVESLRENDDTTNSSMAGNTTVLMFETNDSEIENKLDNDTIGSNLVNDIPHKQNKTIKSEIHVGLSNENNSHSFGNEEKPKLQADSDRFIRKKSDTPSSMMLVIFGKSENESYANKQNNSNLLDTLKEYSENLKNIYNLQEVYQNNETQFFIVTPSQNSSNVHVGENKNKIRLSTNKSENVILEIPKEESNHKPVNTQTSTSAEKSITKPTIPQNDSHKGDTDSNDTEEINDQDFYLENEEQSQGSFELENNEQIINDYKKETVNMSEDNVNTSFSDRIKQKKDKSKLPLSGLSKPSRIRKHEKPKQHRLSRTSDKANKNVLTKITTIKQFKKISQTIIRPT